MKQVLQDRRSGRLEIAETPAPALRAGCVLVRNAASLISSGTERATVELGRRSLLEKALERPDLVRKVMDVARTRGLREAVRAVRARLDEQVPLGYSCSGTIVEVGLDVAGHAPGDRVACAGFGHASHAEFVCIPKNLVVPVPDGVSFEHASFVAVGGIALHGVRTLDPKIGDTVVVIGLGLVGLLSVQILHAGGARVFGLDLSPDRCKLAESLGAETAFPPDPGAVSRVLDLTGGRGADGVLIAAASKSAEPVVLAGEVARDRARVCVVGDVKLDVPRSLYYAKELELRVSRSYGPGRYDSRFEEQGIPYPVGYVPWTEQRNMSEFLRLVQDGRVRLDPLVGQTYPIERALEAYERLTGGGAGTAIATVLTYAPAATPARRLDLSDGAKRPTAARTVSVIGAGTFAKSVLIPRFNEAGAALRGVVTQTGPSAQTAGRRFGFAFSSTRVEDVLDDPRTEIVVVATRHDTHADLAVRALSAGKHVFVEKPLALSRSELPTVLETAAGAPGVLMVGYNRRFAPLTQELKTWLGHRGPIAITCRINAGSLPADTWIRDRLVGGGRIVGEACHFVDLMQLLTDADPVETTAVAVPSRDGASPDTVTFSLRFADGSIGSVHYMSLGDRAMPKERIEVFAPSGAAVLDDFVSLELYEGGRKRRIRSGRQDKGHSEEVKRFLAACAGGGPPPIPLGSLALTSLVTFAVEEALRTGKPVPVEP